MHRNPLSFYHRFLQTLLMRVRPAPLAVFTKRLLAIKRIVVDTPSGTFRIDPASHLGSALTKVGTYEPQMVKTIETLLPQGGTFVDLGANEGFFTIVAARRCGSGGRVVAIEPQRRLLPIIDENLRLNTIRWANVVNAVVTDKPGTVTIHLAPDTNTGGSGLHKNTKYRLATQEVAARTLSQILKDENLTHVDLMKVDIESFEYEALLGSRDVFSKHQVKALALELHPEILESRDKDAADITQMLGDCGYRRQDAFENTVWLAPQ
jgi:FkbM family methyltransferase